MTSFQMFGNLSTKRSNLRNVLSSSLETATLRVYGMEDDMIHMKSQECTVIYMDTYTNHYLLYVYAHTLMCAYGDNFWESLLPFYHVVSGYQPQVSAHPLSSLTGTAGIARHSIVARDFTL